MKNQHGLYLMLHTLLAVPCVHAESFYYEFCGNIESSKSYNSLYPENNLKAVPGVTQRTYRFEVDFNRNTSTAANTAGDWNYFYSDLVGEGLMVSEIGTTSSEVNRSFNAVFRSGNNVGEICGGANGVRIFSSSLSSSNWKVEDWKVGDQFKLVDLAVSSSGGGAVYYFGTASLVSIRPVSEETKPPSVPMASTKAVAANVAPVVSDADSVGGRMKLEIHRGDPALAAGSQDAGASVGASIVLSFNAAIGVKYQIETSTDLDAWSVVETNIVGQGEVITRLYSTENLPSRYFRVRKN